MAKQNINVGTAANDKKGDSLRAAFVKVNANFAELYTALGLDSGGLNLGNFQFTNNTIKLINPATDGSTLNTVIIDQPVEIGSDLTVGGTLTLPANGSISAASNYNLTLGDGLRVNQGGNLSNANEDSWGLYGQNSDAGTYITIPGRTASENGEPLVISHNYDAAIEIRGVGGTWSFDEDASITLPNYGQLRPSSTTYDAALAGWESFRSQEAESAALLGYTEAMRPFIGWRVNGGNVAAYLAELDRVWAIQLTGGSTLVWTPAISSALRAQMRAAMLAVQNAYPSVGSDVSIASGQGKYWNFSGDGTLTIPGDIRSDSNINIEINLADSTKRIWQFGEDGNLETPGGIQVSGILKIDDGVHEQFQAKVDATGVVTHDCSSGHIFYHTSPDANWTANFTNLNLSTTYATSITLIIVQGATGYYPSAVQIAGSAQTINWQGNVNPTVSTSRTDVVTFSIINNSGTYTVLGQLTGF